MKDVSGRWRSCSPESVREFSAAGYYFGRHLHRELNVPVGLVLASHGASPAEAWTEAGALKACIPNAFERWETLVKNYEAAKAEYDREVTAGRRPSKEPTLPREESGFTVPWDSGTGPSHLLCLTESVVSSGIRVSRTSHGRWSTASYSRQ